MISHPLPFITEEPLLINNVFMLSSLLNSPTPVFCYYVILTKINLVNICLADLSLIFHILSNFLGLYVLGVPLKNNI